MLINKNYRNNSPAQTTPYWTRRISASTLASSFQRNLIVMFKLRLCLLPDVNGKTATTVCRLIQSCESVLYSRDKVEFAYLILNNKINL